MRFAKITKLRTAAFLTAAILLFWFLFDLTGLSLGSAKIVVSAFTDEPIDVLWFALACAALLVFAFSEKIGRWTLPAFVLTWAGIQYSMYFGGNIKGYNDFFARDGTCRIFPASEAFLIKDAYHIVLDLLILAAATASVAFLAVSLRKERGGKQPAAENISRHN
ncbi:MAG: hypothetical protein LBP79_04230 [Clostridiales bacterium]|jgi:hypothetical protein|nr:hypothetical protein [Clostridiales bacterium]